jgi:type I restriction-modification system DNA methylase subunit
MSKTFDQGKDEVAKLCQYFATNQQSFLVPGVKEAHVRQSLIDPFFESLGWDVRNDSMIAPQYREVIPEDSLDVEGQQKAPDYTFRVGTLPKFYAEAKKCGVNISADPAPAYQLRRYGFSAKLALSILTDFDELGVYDCASRPRPGDKASHARIQYFGFTEYPDRWREIWDVFSREAVWSGSFDQYAASKRKRGTSEVDSEFLKDIEGWRDVLARNLALRNSDLSVDDLNAAVQRIIDRIIFLRMAEDRGLESYGQLLKLCEQPDIYDRFMRGLCRNADQKYNSGLFHFQKEPGVSDVPDTLTPRLAVDDNALKPILQSLYFEHGCPYHFGVLPVEILGTVYERFLGKVIRLTAGHQAKVEEKPEVRKAGGVYYTPAYIVNYIVHNTIGKQIEGKSPADLAGGKTTPPFRVLDMACGSGSFLLGAYQFLLDHCLKWYLDNPSKKHAKAVYQNAKGETHLTNVERKRILTTHIFGVDIDRQAVETTKLSLLLKALEGENDATLSRQMTLFHERALPNLSHNIKCGNSLIASDFSMVPEDIVRVHAFDWPAQFPDAMKAGGFDALIGNPPYIRIQTLQETNPASVNYLNEHYAAAAKGNYDIYVVFVERALSLLNPNGRQGYILPHKFFNAQYGEALRAHLAKGKHVNGIVHFGDQQVFDGAITYTCLLFLNKQPTTQFDFVSVRDLSAWQSGSGFARVNLPSSKLDQSVWTFSASPSASVLERICAHNAKLADVADRIFQGLVTGADPVFILEKRNKGVFYSEALKREVQLETELLHPLCKGAVNVRRYEIDNVTKRILFPYRVTENKAVLIPPDEFAKKYPKCWRYIGENRKTLESRERGKWRHGKWYAFGRSQNLTEMEQEKILTPSIAKTASFTHDLDDFYYFIGSGGGGGGGYGITLKPDTKESYRYVLALLNSRLLDTIVKSVSSPFANG